MYGLCLALLGGCYGTIFNPAPSPDVPQDNDSNNDTNGDSGTADDVPDDSGLIPDDTDTALGDTADDSGVDSDTADSAGTDTDSAEPTTELVSVVQLVGETHGMAGMSLAGRSDLTGDGLRDLAVGAPGVDVEEVDHPVDGVPAGVVYVAHGPFVEGGNELAATSFRLTTGTVWDGLGTDVEARDVNGDGFTDVIVGAPFGGAPSDLPGEAFVAYGPITEDRNLADGARFTSGLPGDRLGWRVASGDVTGDGFADVLTSAPLSGVNRNGAVAIHRGSGLGAEGSIVASIHGGDFDMLGHELATADVTGDGFDDIVVTARLGEGGENDAGRVHVFNGPIAYTMSTVDADSAFLGDHAWDNMGASLAVGDANGDGTSDLVVGAPDVDSDGTDGGAVYLLHGPVNGVMATPAAAAVVVGEGLAGKAGASVGFAGDMNADGAADLLVGAPYRGSDHGMPVTGKGYLVLSPIAGSVSLIDASRAHDGELNYERLGTRVDGVDDYTSDGLFDFVFSAPNGSYAGARSGIVYLFAGE